jgi:hypothetical protein
VPPVNAGTDSGRKRASEVRWSGALAVVLGAGVIVLGLYLVHPLTDGYTLPIGPDGPVYTWLARATAAIGLPGSPGAGPGVPALTLILGRVLSTDPLGTVTVLGPVLAACSGLAGAALIESSLGPSIRRCVLATLFTGAFAAYLAGGWLANVGMVAVFLTAAAAMTVAVRAWPAVVLCAVLLGAAGLLHQVFFLVGAVILVVVVGWTAVQERRAGRSWTEMGARRMAIALGGGVAVAGAGVLWMSAAPSIPGDTSQDGFFRRVGLRDLLLDRYRERIRGDLGRAAAPVLVGLGLAGVAAPSSRNGRSDGPRFLSALWFVWALVTVGGIAALAVTGWGPPNRLLQFAFFLPIGAALGAAALLQRGVLGILIAAVAATAFVVGSMSGWFRQSPSFTPEELDTVRRAGSVIDALGLERGVPLVFVVDTDQPAAAYHVTRAANLIRMGVPARRIPDVRVVVGAPEDVLAGRVSRTGDAEHDQIASVYLREAGTALDRGVLLLLRPFNASGWDPGRGRVAAPDVMVLSGPTTISEPASPAEGGVGVFDLVWRSVAALVVLGVFGAGWSRWGLRRAGWPGVLAAAPSVGMAVAVLVGVAADRLGLRLDSAGAVLLVLAVGALGFVAASVGHQRPVPTGPQLHPLGQERR